MCFFNSAEYAFLEQILLFSQLRIILSGSLLSKRTQVELDAPPSNVDCFLSRDTCVSSPHLYRPTWNKMCVFNFEILVWKPVFLSKLIQFSWRINVLYATHSNIDAFLFRDTCGSLTHLNMPIWHKFCLFPLENPDSQVVFL
jgi:hypothetical protein